MLKHQKACSCLDPTEVSEPKPRGREPFQWWQGSRGGPMPLQGQILLLFTAIYIFAQGSIASVQPCHLVLISVCLWPGEVKEKKLNRIFCVWLRVYMSFFNAVNDSLLSPCPSVYGQQGK